MWDFLKRFMGYSRQETVVQEVAPYKVETPVVAEAIVPAAAMKVKKPRAKKPKAIPTK